MTIKNISILGSTGSIGQSTLAVVEKFPDRFRVAALAAGNNIELLEKPVGPFKPSTVAVVGEKAAEKLRKSCGDLSVRIFAGVEGMIEVAAAPAGGNTGFAIVGAAGA